MMHRGTAPSCKNTESTGLCGLTVWPPQPLSEHTNNCPYVWACTIFFVASCLHHYLASKCTSTLTLKCLKSNFKLDDIFKFSENNKFSFLWTFLLKDVLWVVMQALSYILYIYIVSNLDIWGNTLLTESNTRRLILMYLYGKYKPTASNRLS